MNYPLWSLPAPGLLIALVAIVHVFVSHFAVGGGLFLVLTESKARREADPALLGYVRRHSRFFALLTLVLGAVTGVGIWFTIGLVHPQATSSLIDIFVWAWAIEWTFFVVEIAAATVYYFGWDRLDAATHERVGWIYAVSAWLSLLVINGILSFMLTPGSWLSTGSMWTGLLNPTSWPQSAARTFAAVGLAGLYAMWTAARIADPALKARVARYAAAWIVPMALALPVSVAWFFHSAAGAGVQAGEVLGLRTSSIGEIASVLLTGSASGYPPAIAAGRTVLVASAATLLLTLVAAFYRPRSYGRPTALLVLAFAFAAMGAGEWVREDLRKPYVIGRYLFVNGIRLTPPWLQGDPQAAPGGDRFDLESVRRTGVLQASLWTRLPVSPPNGDPLKRLESEGREVFRLACSSCHTIDGYLAIRPLVAGRSQEALAGIIARLATDDTEPRGRSSAWTWRGRRMPPFPGSDAERDAVAIYLARMGGASPHLPAPAPGDATSAARAYFGDHCSPCHGPGADFPIGGRGRSAALLYDMIGRLPTVNDAMPPFEGTDQLREALAQYLASLPPAGRHQEGVR